MVLTTIVLVFIGRYIFSAVSFGSGAPITGIVLIFEMTGSLDQMLSLSVVFIVAYITATMLRSEPIYESLLDRFWEKVRGEEKSEGADDGTDGTGRAVRRQKVPAEYGIRHTSPADGEMISEIYWQDNCLLVSIRRGDKEIIPKGQTRLQARDIIVTMTDERAEVYVYERLEKICRETMG